MGGGISKEELEKAQRLTKEEVQAEFNQKLRDKDEEYKSKHNELLTQTATTEEQLANQNRQIRALEEQRKQDMLQMNEQFAIFTNALEQAREHNNKILEETREYTKQALEEANEYTTKALEESKEHNTKALEESKEHNTKALEESKEHNTKALELLRQQSQEQSNLLGLLTMKLTEPTGSNANVLIPVVTECPLCDTTTKLNFCSHRICPKCNVQGGKVICPSCKSIKTAPAKNPKRKEKQVWRN